MCSAVFAALVAAVTMSGYADGGERTSPKVLKFQIQVCECEGPGNFGLGHKRVLSQPQLVTHEGQPARYLVGQSVQVPGSSETIDCGVSMLIAPGTVKDGKVRLDITFEHSRPVENTDERLQVNTEVVRAVRTVKLGEAFLLKIEKGVMERHVWAVVHVEEFKP
jgi:hypothetical protein